MPIGASQTRARYFGGNTRQLREGLVDAVNAPTGTAHAASLDNIDVAGKTGTAQWGPKNRERTAAWFAGFLPAGNRNLPLPLFTRAMSGSKEHGGTTAAPMIGEIFRQVYKGQAKTRARRASPSQSTPRAEPVEDDQSD